MIIFAYLDFAFSYDSQKCTYFIYIFRQAAPAVLNGTSLTPAHSGLNPTFIVCFLLS